MSDEIEPTDAAPAWFTEFVSRNTQEVHATGELAIETRRLNGNIEGLQESVTKLRERQEQTEGDVVDVRDKSVNKEAYENQRKVERSIRRVAVSLVVFMVVAFGSILGYFIAVNHHRTTQLEGVVTGLKANNQSLLDDSLARAESSFEGCNTRNEALAAQTSLNASLLKTIASFGPGAAPVVARFKIVFDQYASSAKPADCSIYTVQEKELLNKGAHEMPSPPILRVPTATPSPK